MMESRNDMNTGLLFVVLAAVISAWPVLAGERFSRAGYWEVVDSPRATSSFNCGWEFSLDGFKTAKAVNLPHSIDEGEIGLNASGCVNRQQKAWYRKRFVAHASKLDWEDGSHKFYIYGKGVAQSGTNTSTAIDTSQVERKLDALIAKLGIKEGGNP